jgi:hypothetical protein
MAIIRCPYCHAIIDENDKYCNNCGTQLLFPEDESVEEEIPGEKLVDAEGDEEKDYDTGEPGKETTALLEEDEEEEKEEERTGELVTGPASEPGTKNIGELLEGEETEPDDVEAMKDEELKSEEDEPEEVTVVDEIEARETAAKEEKPEEETKAYPVRPVEERAPEAEIVEAAAPQVPATFDTRELESIGKTVDLGKDRVDKMIEVLAEKQKEASVERAAEPGPEKKTGTLPPWASKIKSDASVVEREGTRDVGRRFEKETWSGAEKEAEPQGPEPAGATAKTGEAEEEEIFPRRKPPDSGIGLPEKVTQAALPFEPAAVRGGELEEKEAEAEIPGALGRPAETEIPKREAIRPPVREEAQAETGFEKELEEEELQPPFQFSVFFKAKAFDILFIGVFWLVALWVAARSMGATLFELLSVTSGSVLLLYAVFLILYFFLFQFFLGETLGDRLFKERE